MVLLTESTSLPTSEQSPFLQKRCNCLKRQLSKKPWQFVGSLLFILVSLFPIQVRSQELVYIDYIESFKTAPDTNAVSLPIVKKENRLKSNSCITFRIEHEQVPDSVVKCLEVAADIWRSCLNINSNKSIRLQLKWEDLPYDEDVIIKVTYVKNNDNNFIPTSLYYCLMSDLPNEGYPDATITINKNVSWDCGYSIENGYSTRSLNYAMLRSIAVALGFGSSISLTKLNTGSIVKFQFSQGHSLFENLLVSENGIWLKSLRNKGREQNDSIINYCTGVYGNVYIDGDFNNATEREKYKMYTPSNYENSKSLIYLDNKNSLMHYSLDKQTKYLQIDTVTINVLNKLGWSLVDSNVNNISIVGSGIPESGVTSAYISHLFYIEGDGKDEISDARWSFYLPTIDGNQSLQKTAEGTQSFTIDKVSSPENFAINVNGDIYGKIIFTGVLNGTPINLQYNITLELKPSISNVIFDIKNNEIENSYDVICKVDYKGSDFLYVTLEEEYGSSLRSQFVREPYLAHFVCGNVASPYYAWIDIKAENKYGSEVYTIELPPYNSMRRMQNLISSKVHILTDNDYSEIKVYKSSGLLIKTIKDTTETGSLQSGIYILEYFKGCSKVKTTKLIK